MQSTKYNCHHVQTRSLDDFLFLIFILKHRIIQDCVNNILIHLSEWIRLDYSKYKLIT